MLWPDGTEYKGQFFNGFPHGFGVVTIPGRLSLSTGEVGPATKSTGIFHYGRLYLSAEAAEETAAVPILAIPPPRPASVPTRSGRRSCASPRDKTAESNQPASTAISPTSQHQTADHTHTHTQPQRLSTSHTQSSTRPPTTSNLEGTDLPLKGGAWKHSCLCGRLSRLSMIIRLGSAMFVACPRLFFLRRARLFPRSLLQPLRMLLIGLMQRALWLLSLNNAACCLPL